MRGEGPAEPPAQGLFPGRECSSGDRVDLLREDRGMAPELRRARIPDVVRRDHDRPAHLARGRVVVHDVETKPSWARLEALEGYLRIRAQHRSTDPDRRILRDHPKRAPSGHDRRLRIEAQHHAGQAVIHCHLPRRPRSAMMARPTIIAAPLPPAGGYRSRMLLRTGNGSGSTRSVDRRPTIAWTWPPASLPPPRRAARGCRAPHRRTDQRDQPLPGRQPEPGHAVRRRRPPDLREPGERPRS